MKIRWVWFLVFLVALVVTGCNAVKDEEAADKLIDQGYIVQIDSNGKRILVTDPWDGAGQPYPQAAWLTIGDQTALLDQQQEIGFEALRTGWIVETWSKGAVAESYPLQAEAAKVVVKAKGDETAAVSRALTRLEGTEPLFIQQAAYDPSQEIWTVQIAKLGSTHTFDVNLKTGEVRERGNGDGGHDEGDQERNDERAQEPTPAQVVAENEAFRIFQPAPHAVIGKTLTIKGEARVFEATFSYSLEDGHNILAKGHVQASKGAPEWGSFELEVTIDHVTSPAGVLSLFELSAKDGSPQHVLNIPVTFEEELIRYE